MLLAATEDETFVSLWGKDQRARLILKVDKENRPSVELSGATLNPAVGLWADPEDHGQAWVYSPEGKPRSGMHSTGVSGVVCATADDGTVRAFLRSEEEGGRVSIALPGQICAEMRSSEAGGAFVSFGAELTTPAAILSANLEGDGLFILHRRDGQIGALLACEEKTAVLTIHGPASTDESDSPANSLRLAGTDSGSSIELFDGLGTAAIRLTTVGTGAAVSLYHADDHAAIQLLSTPDNNVLTVNHPDNEGNVTLASSDEGGHLQMHSADGERRSVLHFVENGGALTFYSDRAGTSIPVALGYTLGEDAYLKLQRDGLASSISLFTHDHGGSFLIHGIDGTRQAGMVAGEHGGSAAVFSELGVERAVLGSKGDGGSMILKWGGTNGIFAGASDRGGLLTAHDPAGEIRAVFPDLETFGDPEEPGESGHD